MQHCPICGTDFPEEMAECPTCGGQDGPVHRCANCGEEYQGSDACPACGSLREPVPCQVHPERRANDRCVACGHRCPIQDGHTGVCRVRFNRGGRIRVPAGYVAGVQVDPIEKKPFFHVHPGALAYSFGMLGCDLHCAYCQNWVTSQALRDPHAVASPLDVLTDPLTRDVLWFTVWQAALSTVLALMAGLPAAYSIATWLPPSSTMFWPMM